MIPLKYVKENRVYQKHLDKKYNGTIIPIDMYFNNKSVIKHFCLTCGEFYAKASHLLYSEKFPHICEARHPKQVHAVAKGDRLTEEQKVEIVRLHKDGKSISGLSTMFGVSRYQIRKAINGA